MKAIHNYNTKNTMKLSVVWDQSYIIIESNSQLDLIQNKSADVVWDQSYIIIESNSQPGGSVPISSSRCVGSKLHNN